jgi:hypothetical protein
MIYPRTPPPPLFSGCGLHWGAGVGVGVGSGIGAGTNTPSTYVPDAVVASPEPLPLLLPIESALAASSVPSFAIPTDTAPINPAMIITTIRVCMVL